MTLSELSQSESSPSSSQVAPLALSTVKLRYPRLYREYCLLSDREGEWRNCDTTSPPPPIDDATGLHTTICYTDFAAPLDGNDGCPMTTESDANRFSVFVWKCLIASESGDGGDALRQFDVLRAALDDAVAVAPSSPGDRFLHLLGWTSAALNHGLHSLLCGGDPERNRALFKAAADVWKKAFDKTHPGGGGGGGRKYPHVTGELRDFAIWTCRNLQILLRDAKREAGNRGDVNYGFNFIRKPRAKKGTTARAIATASSSSLPLAPVKNTVEITVTRPSKDHLLGLGITQELKGMKVKTIAATSIFHGTPLTVDMRFETINGMGYSSFQKGMELLRNAEGKMIVVFSFPSSAPPSPAATAASIPAAAPSVVGATKQSLSLDFDREKNDVAKREASVNGGDDSVKRAKAS